MFPTAFNPYWWMPPFAAGFNFGGGYQQRQGLVPTILNTRGVQLTDATVDFGIDPRQYACLPCESELLDQLKHLSILTLYMLMFYLHRYAFLQRRHHLKQSHP